METDTTGEAFAWLRRVDAELERVIGLTTGDLPDRNYRDEFEAGLSPREAALETLEENGLEGLDVEDEREIAGAVEEPSGLVTSDADPGL